MPRGRPSTTAPKAFTHDSSTRTGLAAGGTAGNADLILALVEKAGREALTPDEKKLLEEALRNHLPWLEWSGKRESEEKGYFEVDPVALSIHERMSPQAILRAAKREDIQREHRLHQRG